MKLFSNCQAKRETTLNLAVNWNWNHIFETPFI